MLKKYIFVTTTIHVPVFLKDYVKDCLLSGYPTAEFVVIGDQGMPPETGKFIESVGKQGIRVDYWDIGRQKKWLRRFPELDRLLPYRSIQRRNLGYLIAYLNGADVIISLDDDNFLVQPDYLSGHRWVGEERSVNCASSTTGWFNVCSFLKTKPSKKFYHRGYPLSRRWLPEKTKFAQRRGKIVVNAGLWVGDPDVDTVTRVEEPFKVVGFKSRWPHFGLGRGTMSPFNSQNTAFSKDLLPFLYLIVAGDRLRGFKSDFRNFRYDDIWMSYFAKLAIDRMGDLVTYGQPIVLQNRNPHDLWVDMDRELIPMMLTEKLARAFLKIKLRSNSYPVLYAELIDHLRNALCHSTLTDPAEKVFFSQMLRGMSVWLDVCSKIMRG